MTDSLSTASDHLNMALDAIEESETKTAGTILAAVLTVLAQICVQSTLDDAES